MPKMKAVKGEDGKFIVQSQAMAEGGPADTWIGVTEDKAFLAGDTQGEVEEFLRDNGGGSLYFITHYKRYEGTEDEEWSSKSYPRGEVESNKAILAKERLLEAKAR